MRGGGGGRNRSQRSLDSNKLSLPWSEWGPVSSHRSSLGRGNFDGVQDGQRKQVRKTRGEAACLEVRGVAHGPQPQSSGPCGQSFPMDHSLPLLFST